MALERIRGLVRAEIADESLLGFRFSLTADLLSDESGFSCTERADWKAPAHWESWPMRCCGF